MPALGGPGRHEGLVVSEDQKDRAVVLGAGMAGLLAARVLADHYPEVVLVDRDRVLGVRDARRGVPQGHHAHGLLAKGQQILEELFPVSRRSCPTPVC